MRPINQLRVLVADDHLLTRQFVRNTLQDSKIEHIDTAADGEEALKMAEQAVADNNVYDIVFLDWSMPGLSGFDVLTKLRTLSEFEKTALVMLTAESEQRSIMQAIKSGATSYIIKPVSPSDLAKKLIEIYEWLRRKRDAEPVSRTA